MPPMIRVLHIIDSRATAEVFDQLSLLARHDDVVVLVGNARSVTGCPCEVIRFRAPLGLEVLSGFDFASSAKDFDLIQAWEMTALPPALRCAWRAKRPLLLWLAHAPGTEEARRIVKLSTEHRFEVLVTTLAAMSELSQHGLNNQAHVLPPAVPQRAFEDRPAARQMLGLTTEIAVVAPADVTLAADPKLPAWAHAILEQLRSDIRLIYPSTGPAIASLTRFVNDAACPAQTRLPSEVNQRNQAIAAADLVLLPFSGPAPLSAAAGALAAGKTIIASDLPELRQLLGEAVAYIPPKAPRLWAGQILRLIEDDAAAENLRQAALSRAAELNLSDVPNRLLELQTTLVPGS